MHRTDSTRSNASSRSYRASTSDSKQQEDLINALEAEEERLVNTLTRKLEKLRAEKVELENVLEAESESLVLRLQRQLSLLMQQQQQNGNQSSATNPHSATSPTSPSGPLPTTTSSSLVSSSHPLNPSPTALIEVLKSENSNLRTRLVDTEREYIKTTRQNEMYRSELIALRQMAGMPIDDLIGAAPSVDDYPSAMAARRRSRGGSTGGNGIPIPGLSGGDVRRRTHHVPSFSSSSIYLGNSSFTPSTPMTPSSLVGDGANHIIMSHGTSLTTPSTSYPGPPVPHSTPAASPADGRHHEHSMRSHSPGSLTDQTATISPQNSRQAVVYSSDTGRIVQTSSDTSPSARMPFDLVNGKSVRAGETDVISVALDPNQTEAGPSKTTKESCDR
ncbi:hypothetical protein BY996DRAFT_4580962 [Phakopsora pachyrhizi]|nr:hypothetical protein BY996DRAFT_4580962 [Phakopsora pachyrhizi]